LRFKIHHVPGWTFWQSAAQTVNLKQPAFPLSDLPFVPQKVAQLISKNQRRATLGTHWQPGLDPGPHGILVDVKEHGDFLNRVVAMNLR
jgi:hypothetical protein